ncbi:Glucosyl transferase GtrII [Desulfacinum infernum DSM 9756]|uniref:Glucosyl transferase GtrII n=1 Tax=Desulfacinum infernum DSM 9756 TaxID=1121391 RepID=A0A1M4WWZ0_9BACT|nr:glucosyltransferase domain-containing protein [Desulfacinum infernum]SHE85764.1 Glucosyl transferase GtrII [Desulfacinum infernum DSM 9756]
MAGKLPVGLTSLGGLGDTPIERRLTPWWDAIDPAYKKAFAAIFCCSVLAFGFELFNLTLHHDDLNHLMVQKPLVGYYLGRFGHAWLFYYVQGGRFVPLLDTVVGTSLMGLYGLVVGHFWGARKTLDLALIGCILSVFPYMAHVYQYNSVMIAYPLAHLLSALAVILSVRKPVLSVPAAAFLYILAFSIYQSVLANAVTIFLLWIVIKVLFFDGDRRTFLCDLVRPCVTAILSLLVGGSLYALIIFFMNIPFDASQGADRAFSLTYRLQHPEEMLAAMKSVFQGTRAFFMWPENYFPNVVKRIQLLLILLAVYGCGRLVVKRPEKALALALFFTACFTPRTLQILHPRANYHVLTLTAYALVVAGAFWIVSCSWRRPLARNVAVLLSIILVLGYAAQCNWISTVNYLNTLSHYSTLTQVLARLRSLPDTQWDGKTVAVVGSYNMPSTFPFKPATGVATEFMDARHMRQLASLMRDEAVFIQADSSMPQVLSYASSHPPWPKPGSVGVVNGMGVVVFSKD